MAELQLEPIGIIRSCFKEKFGIPRQPGLIDAAEATLELLPPYNRAEAVRGLEGFSHVWLIFGFHATAAQGWRPTVRPPRLGGNARLGVFATRSTFRPNPLGLSVVRLDGIDTGAGVSLRLAGVDLLDGTPVFDIKPYLPYADALPDASSGFAPDDPPAPVQVRFAPQAERQLTLLQRERPRLRELVTQLLAYDPRPAYRSDSQAERDYGVKLYDLDVRWRMHGDAAEVTALLRQNED